MQFFFSHKPYVHYVTRNCEDSNRRTLNRQPKANFNTVQFQHKNSRRRIHHLTHTQIHFKRGVPFSRETRQLSLQSVALDSRQRELNLQVFTPSIFLPLENGRASIERDLPPPLLQQKSAIFLFEKRR